MIVDQVQRWTLGREYRRPAGETIRTSEYDVEPTIDRSAARAFIKRHHYSHEPSPDAHSFDLYHRGELVGVALFGPPPSAAAHQAVWPGLADDAAVTWGRLVLLDRVPSNAESWCGARCFELLARAGVVGVESCADPVERVDVAGRRVFPGHGGTVYQALNARYIGRTNPSTLWLLPDGTVFSARAAAKVRKGERGAARAIGKLVCWGADPLDASAPEAERRAWLRYWISRLTRRLRHHGNHRYLWCLDKRRRREVLTAPALAYPKIDLERAA